MRRPKAEQLKLPYASTVASFYGDQGQPSDTSFLGRLFRKGGMGGATAATGAPAGTGAGMMK